MAQSSKEKRSSQEAKTPEAAEKAELANAEQPQSEGNPLKPLLIIFGVLLAIIVLFAVFDKR